jgi:HK97 family phage major capsid protein
MILEVIMSFSKSLIEKRDAALAKADAIVAAAQTEARELTPEQDAEIVASLDEVRSLDEQIATHSELEKRSAEAAELRKEKKFDAVASPAVVKSEARTYSPQAEVSFVADAYAAQFNNDFSAKERLARHMNEEKIERRDVTSANFAGLIVPQFLTDLAAPFARAGRPTADVARKHELPASGLTISISKVTTGSSVASQNEGAAVSETNMDDTKLDVSVNTFAGQQNVSRQALERGTGIDSLVMADLVSAYHTALDAAVVTEVKVGNGNTVTYTDASPTVAELYPKILDAVQKIQTSFFAGPNVMIMHPRRLAWILSALDQSNRPLAVPVGNGAFNAVAVGQGSVVYGNSGYTIAGLPVVTDANVTTTDNTDQDAIYIGSTQELHLWEQGAGEPMMLRFEQPKGAELDVQMIVYGYSAFTVRRYPKAWAEIIGTGLAAPSF